MIAAYVDGVPLPADEVLDRLSVMRRGPAAALLPDASTAEGRQLVRWLTQVAVTERVLVDEAARRGLEASSVPWPLDPTSRVQLGGALAAALAASAVATAAAHAITADVTLDPEPAEELTACVSRWVASSGPAGPDNGGRRWLLDVDSLPAQTAAQVLAGADGDRIGVGTVSYELAGWGPQRQRLGPAYDPVAAARNLALLRWVDGRIAATVTLQHGFEHPGDLSQPDHTHRH